MTRFDTSHFSHERNWEVPGSLSVYKNKAGLRSAETHPDHICIQSASREKPTYVREKNGECRTLSYYRYSVEMPFSKRVFWAEVLGYLVWICYSARISVTFGEIERVLREIRFSDSEYSYPDRFGPATKYLWVWLLLRRCDRNQLL